MIFNGIPVYQDPATPLERILEDGSIERVDYIIVKAPTPCVLVHPDRWSEFCAALNIPEDL